MGYIECVQIQDQVVYTCRYQCNGRTVELTADTEDGLIELISTFLNRPDVLDDTQITSSFLMLV